MPGPLVGLRVVELASIGPGPHAAMVLADLGADVVRVERPGAAPSYHHDITLRGRSVLAADLKGPRGRDALLALAATADVLIEGMRPGVAERLGVGPDVCLERNPALVYGRMTGWGQTGPLAPRAGHDINYIALTGDLDALGPAHGRPVPPLNLVGDYGGGSMLLLVGILAALFERRASGLGQVVDAAMVDGASLLGQVLWNQRANGQDDGPRGRNLLDGGAPFYGTYACRDGRFVAVGAIEERFYRQLIERLGLDGEDLPAQYDRSQWPGLRETLEAVFASRDRDHWLAVFDGTDACVTPVLGLDEVATHPHMVDRGTIREHEGCLQVAPAPRFSRSAPDWPPRARGVSVEVASVVERWSSMAHGTDR